MQIFLARNGQTLGPYSLSEVNDQLRSGSVTLHDPAWYAGADTWVPVGQIAGIAPPPQPAPPVTPPEKSSPIMQLGKVVAGIVVVLLSSLLLSIRKQHRQEALKEFRESRITSSVALNAVASKINQTTPMMVGGDMELMNAAGLENVLVYNYRILTTTVDTMDVDQFRAKMTDKLRASVCTTPETRDEFLKKGVTLRYSYVDKGYTFVAAIDVTPAACGF